MFDLLFTPSTGHVDAEVYYAQAVDETTGFMWDGSAVTEDPSYASTVISLTEINNMGVWGFTAPDDLPAGIFSIVCRKQAGVSTAATDNVADVKRLRKDATGRVMKL